MLYFPFSKVTLTGKTADVRHETAVAPKGRKCACRHQDEATRAWNFFSALYYKAGGFPWRIPRVETDYQTCFIGIAFLQSPDKTQMHSSVVQVFGVPLSFEPKHTLSPNLTSGRSENE